MNDEKNNYDGEIKEESANKENRIHQTNPDFNDVQDEDTEEKPQRNFATDVPFDEESEDKSAVKNKGGLFPTIAATLVAVIILFAIVVFFIVRGKPQPEVANVKDNTSKLGVNANVATTGGSVPNFEEDYQERYGTNSNTMINPNSNNAGNANINGISPANYPPYGTVSDITAPPQTFPTGGIYQPNAANNVQTQEQANSQNGTSSSGGGRNESNRIKPDRDTEIVEMGDKKSGSNRNSSSGGRNEQVSLYFLDRSDDSGDAKFSRIEYENASPVKPTFGTVLPVRILGRIHTLGTNGFARMELTRTVQGNWGTIPRGTLFVGRVSGGEGNRVFVSLIGYIDLRSNRLVKLGGDLQGIDGALGIEGDVKRLGSRWSRVFGEVLSSAKEIGSAYLLGRRGGSGTVINNGQLERIPNSLEGKNDTRYTIVPAGANAYIVLNDLPPAIESDERLADKPRNLTDDEILKMINTNSPSEIENMMPGLSAEGRLIARRALENK